MGKCSHDSTFKFQPASTTYNPARSPAYTDRILYQSPPALFIPLETSAFPASLQAPASPNPSTPTKGSSTGPAATAVSDLPTQSGPSAEFGSDSNADLSAPDAAALTDSVRCTEYTSHPIMWSDHRPVSASFRVPVRVADDARRLGVLREGAERLAALEKVWRPLVEVVPVSPVFPADDLDASTRDRAGSGATELSDRQSAPETPERPRVVTDICQTDSGPDSGSDVDFGEVRVRQRKVREVELRNMGRVEVRWKWREAMKDGSLCACRFRTMALGVMRRRRTDEVQASRYTAPSLPRGRSRLAGRSVSESASGSTRWRGEK